MCPQFHLEGLNEFGAPRPAHVSSSVFKCLRWKIGHGLCQLRRAVLLTVTFVLGKVTTMCQVSILLTAVNTNCCFCCCCRGDGRRGCWHKLDWWHVRLVFGSLKRTGPNSFNCVCVCVRNSKRLCVCLRLAVGLSPCYSEWTLTSVCFCDRRSGHQLFQ